MTTFITRVPNEEDTSKTPDHTPNQKDQFSGRLLGIKDMFQYHSRIRILTRYLVRIIAVILSAGAIAGLFELLR